MPPILGRCSSCRVNLEERYTYRKYVGCRERNRVYNREHRIRATQFRPPRAPRLPAAFISELKRIKTSYLGRMDVKCHDCGALHWKEEKPLTRTRTNPHWVSCCKKGSVELPLLQAPPEPLNSLMNGSHQKSTHFLTNIRQYNSAFAFTSFGTTGNSDTPGRFKPVHS